MAPGRQGRACICPLGTTVRWDIGSRQSGPHWMRPSGGWVPWRLSRGGRGRVSWGLMGLFGVLVAMFAQGKGRGDAAWGPPEVESGGLSGLITWL